MNIPASELMMQRFGPVLSAAVAIALFPMDHRAQQPAAAEPGAGMPAVGEMAPDFALRGITRYGMLAQPSRLSDLRGQTVVLAFFVAARTRG